MSATTLPPVQPERIAAMPAANADTLQQLLRRCREVYEDCCC